MRRAVSSTFKQLPVGAGSDAAITLVKSRPESSLVRHLLSFPLARHEKPRKADRRLVELASAILDAETARRDYFSSDLLEQPVWTLMLLAYVRHGQSAGIAVDSLCESPAIGPVRVVLRWTARLLSDGLFELAENQSCSGGPVVRLSPDAMDNLEDWLRLTGARFASAVQTK